MQSVASSVALKKDMELVKSSGLFNASWYKAQYPDVEMLGMLPSEHFIKYGGLMGRSPSKNFDSTFYLGAYARQMEGIKNPLLHFILHGEKEGFFKRPAEMNKSRGQARSRMSTLRRKLLTLGFTEQPLHEMTTELSNRNNPFMRAYAARELALWHMRTGTPDGYESCLSMLPVAGECIEEPKYFAQLAVLEALCYLYLNQKSQGQAVLKKAQQAGYANADLLLTHSNFFSKSEAKLTWINQALALYSIPEITFIKEGKLSLYDRLSSPPMKKEDRINGPLISVLVASYNAEKTLPTTLRSLRDQTWQNLEILVLDDCSTDGTAEIAERFAATDSRIRLIRMPVNGGAYVARNHGLDQAKGEFVTIHDADDWSHPIKLATQAQFLLDNPIVVGCVSQQARSTADLIFSRITSNASILTTNISSFMFRKDLVKENLGFWDNVRFGADSELIRRIELKFGDTSVVRMETGPLSFQRDSSTSIVSDAYFGFDGAPKGIRQEYLEAQTAYHTKAKSLFYGNDVEARKFPIAMPMSVKRTNESQERRHFDVIIASDFRMQGGSTQSNLQEILAHKQYGIKTAIFQMYRYDFDASAARMMLPEVRAQIDGKDVEVLTYGEKASCDLLILRYPPVLQYPLRYIPEIEAKTIKVIINQPPMSDYTDDGVVRYSLERCTANIISQFKNNAEWHPIGPLVRDALNAHHADELPHIKLSHDWHNIIDIKGWSRGKRTRGPGDKLRIGRHSRDNPVKWPKKAEDILAAYPASDDVEVHVLGGANSPISIIGQLPGNWIVHPFDSLHPKDFLADLDVFVYFAHEDWVESFGRTIIEAIAVGIPVILPEIYEPLFKEAAIYATPQTAVEAARKLHSDSKAYDAQVARASRYAKSQFSYEMHIERLKKLGIEIGDRK